MHLDEKCKLLGNFEKILKIFDENSIEKLNYFYFGKFVTKNSAFGNNTIFLQHFFGFGGGGFPPFPLATSLALQDFGSGKNSVLSIGFQTALQGVHAGGRQHRL